MTRSLTRSLLKGLIWATLVGVAFVYVATNRAPERVEDTSTYAQSVVADVDCVAPAKGVLPTGVVLTLDTEVAARYTDDPALVGQAIDHALSKVDNDVWSVTAFCA